MANTWTSQRSATGSYSWSTPSNNANSPWYDGGTQTARAAIPADGDTITIAVGHVVTFDNQTQWVNNVGTGITLKINGTLTFTVTAGNYYLKLAANVTSDAGGPGLKLFQIATAGSPSTAYPQTCTATIYPNGFTFDGTNGLKLEVLCTDPTPTYAKVIGVGGKVITGISSANPAKVTCSTAHGFAAGAVINLVDIVGTTELNGCRVKVLNANPDNVAPAANSTTFTMQWFDPTPAIAVDSTVLTGYISGGYACPQTVAAGNTLYVDTDLTGSTPWNVAGALVQIANVARAQAVSPTNLTYYGISSITSNTVLLNGNIYNNVATSTSSGNTCPSVEAGAYLILVQRNVRFMGSVGASSGLCNTMSGSILAAEMHTGNGNIFGTGVYSTNNIIVGGTYTGNNTVFSSSNNYSNVISYGVFIGHGNGVIANNSNNNLIYNGIFVGNAYVVAGFYCTIYNGIYAGNTNVITGSNTTISGGVFTGNGPVIPTNNNVLSGGSYAGNDRIMGGVCGNTTFSGGTYVGNNCILWNGSGGAGAVSNNIFSGGTFIGNNYIVNNGSATCFGNVFSGGKFIQNNCIMSNTTYNNIIKGGEFTNNNQIAQASLNLNIVNVTISGTPSGAKTFDGSAPLSLSNVTITGTGSTAINNCGFVTASNCNFANAVDIAGTIAVLGNCVSTSPNLATIAGNNTYFVMAYEHNTRSWNSNTPSPAGSILALMPAGTVTYYGADPNIPALGNVHLMTFANINPSLPMSASYPMWLTPQTLTLTVNYKRSAALGVAPLQFQLINGDTSLGCSETPITPTSVSSASLDANGIDSNIAGNNNTWLTNNVLTYTITQAGLYTFRLWGQVASGASATAYYSWQPNTASLAAVYTYTNLQTSVSLIQGQAGTVYFTLNDALNSPTVQISKNGGTFNTAANSIVALAGGVYSLALTTGETDTVGQVAVKVVNEGKTYYVEAAVAASAMTTNIMTDADGRVSLAATGLDAIPLTAPTGKATTFRETLVQLYRRFFGKVTMDGSTLHTYTPDGSQVATTQATTDDGTTQTQGEAT